MDLAGTTLDTVITLLLSEHDVAYLDISQRQLSTNADRTELVITLRPRNGLFGGRTQHPPTRLSWEERISDLYGSHRIIRTLSGSVAIRQSPDHGSALEVFIPFEKFDQPGPRCRPDGWRVLLVEDDPTNAWVLDEMLTALGCTVTLARDGQEAVQIADRAFDLILMDRLMPTLDGLEATRMIRENERQRDHYTPIIALTAYLDGDAARLFELAGANAFVPKPVSLARLYEILASHLGPDFCDPGLRATQTKD